MTEREKKYDSVQTDRQSAVMQSVSDGAELRRLLRFRIVGTAVIWLLALVWSAYQPANIAVLSAAASLSMLVTFAVLGFADKIDPNWLGEMHVAADLLLMPAFVTATGGWRSPFAAVLLAKGVAGALIVGRRRAAFYGTGTIFVALLCWIAVEIRTAPPGATAGDVLTACVPPVMVAAILGALGAVLMQSASFPIDSYRARRRELLVENRRLEEALAELETQNRRLVALQELSRDIGALGSILEIAGKLQFSVKRTFPSRDASIFLVRRDTSVLEPIVLAPGVARARALELLAGGGSLSRGAASRDVAAPNDPEFLDPRNLSQVLVPMHLGEKAIGLLVLESRLEDRFDADDAQLLSTMANEMAVALRNAELNARAGELRESLESLIENANALILVVDASGAIQVVNRALLALLDPDRDLAVGAHAAELFSAESARELERTLALAREGKAVENLTLVLRSGKNAERRAVFNLAPVLDREGKFRSAIAVGQDVTRQELLERSVIQSEKLASLGQFVAGIAHEMNNPLTAITVYADYLRTAFRKGPLAPDAGEKLEEIAFAGERIQGFVQSLLGFARPTANTPRALDINALVTASMRLCHYDLKKGAVEVSTNYGERLPWIAGVEGELQQVFINLFTNAAQALPENGGHLRITTTPEGDGVRVTVADNGSGIPGDVLPRIFEPFFSTKQEGKGTGLGLSIVKRIIEEHRGRIAVESVPGAGTTFTIDLPRAPSARAGVLIN